MKYLFSVNSKLFDLHYTMNCEETEFQYFMMN